MTQQIADALLASRIPLLIVSVVVDDDDTRELNAATTHKLAKVNTNIDRSHRQHFVPDDRRALDSDDCDPLTDFESDLAAASRLRGFASDQLQTAVGCVRAAEADQWAMHSDLIAASISPANRKRDLRAAMKNADSRLDNLLDQLQDGTIEQQRRVVDAWIDRIHVRTVKRLLPGRRREVRQIERVRISFHADMLDLLPSILSGLSR